MSFDYRLQRCTRDVSATRHSSQLIDIFKNIKQRNCANNDFKRFFFIVINYFIINCDKSEYIVLVFANITG